MKTRLLLLVCFLFPSLASAVTVSVVGKDGALLFAQTVDVAVPSTVGKISVDVFDRFSVPYDGSIYGISEIYGTPQELDIISNSEMKAYGWCFAINGVVPETLTDETQVTEQDADIEWYYAYAHYKSGDWISQCTRSY